MKILLVKPKARLQTIRKLGGLIFLEPLELGYVAAAVPEGHSVEILDLRLARNPDRIFRARLKSLQPDLIGISSYTHEVTKVIELAGLARKTSPKSKIVIGGHHATVLPGDFNRPEFDAIVRGEGCAPFHDVVQCLEKGNTLSHIENVMIPGTNWSREEAEELPLYPAPDTLPEPKRNLWNPEDYRCFWPTMKHPQWQTVFPKTALLRTSFGCCMNCNFCVIPLLSRRTHMPRDPEKVVDELEKIQQDHVYFCDDETFIDPGHAQRIAEAIQRRGINKRYFAWARSTTVNRHPDLFKLWRSIGLDCVFLGMEAATNEQLDSMDKHSTIEENQQAHQALINMDIAVQAAFMVNADYTEKDFNVLCDYIEKIPPAQVTSTVFTPSPGSTAWHEEKDKYICHPYDLHDCMHPLTRTKIPLRKFYRHFSRVAEIGGKRNPLRNPQTRMMPRDIFRIIRSVSGYSSALKNAWKDF
ncbi:cobalamin-dependent protein [Pontiellaceae bacterium B12227]|nr:cobalamin-dependent protein [Pontiellaceae bacterium B12227]